MSGQGQHVPLHQQAPEFLRPDGRRDEIGLSGRLGHHG